MTTLRLPRPSDFDPEEWVVLCRIAKRMGRAPEALFRPDIFGVQAHWPAWLEANQEQTRYSFRGQGILPRIAKEAMHVAVSMTNRCDY